jgi:hypothetical protein
VGRELSYFVIYYCDGCDRCVPSPICDSCYNIVDASCGDVEAGLPDIATPAQPIKWAVVTAHWGDVICSLANLKVALDRLGQRSCNVLYWGSHPEIVGFIEQQQFVDQVLYSTSKEGYRTFSYAVWLRTFPLDVVRNLLPRVDGFDAEDAYVECLITAAPDMQCRIEPVFSPSLSPQSVEWSSQFLYDTFGDDLSNVVLLHPSSTWSSCAEDHHSVWPSAIDWLLNSTGYTYLLTGLNAIDIDHPRLVNAVGRLPTNQENLGLVELLPRVVTTNNSVSIYATAIGKPSLVLSNRGACANQWNPYRRFFDRPPNEFLPFDSTLDDFQCAARRYFLV